MDAILLVIIWLLPLAYLALALDYGVGFILRSRVRCPNLCIAIVIALHLGFLTLWTIRFNQPPLTVAMEVLSVMAVCSAIVYWAVELLGRDRRGGVFIFILIFMLQYTSSTFLAGVVTGARSLPAGGGLGRLHILPATFAYTVLTFAAMYAVLHLIGRRNLKQHRLGLLFDRLPPLELLGRTSWCSLSAAFVLLTLTMATGALFFSSSQSVAHGEAMPTKVLAKIVIGSAAWIICSIAVAGKLFGKWSMLTISRITVLGFALIAALFIASAILS